MPTSARAPSRAMTMTRTGTGTGRRARARVRRRRATTRDDARDDDDEEEEEDDGGGGGFFADKVRFVRDNFNAYRDGARTTVETFPSPRARGFRARAAFGIARGDAGDTVRLATASGSEARAVDAFPDGAAGVERAAGAFARVVNRSSHRGIRRRVAAVNFLTNRVGDQVVVGVTTTTKTKTRGVDEEDEEEDRRAFDAFAAAMMKDDSTIVGVVRRRRKRAPYVVGQDFVVETMTTTTCDGRRVVEFKHTEGSFSNPNPDVAELTANFLCDVARELTANGGERATRFVELYAGCGNHTVTLAPYFRGGALAVEINPALVDAARENFARNNVVNATIVNVAAEDWVSTQQALRDDDKERAVVLVDPPRAGLDAKTLDFITSSKAFDAVIYVACDALSLKRDIEDPERGFIARGFTLTRLAVFDHAPTSRRWIELVGVFVRR